MAITQLTQPATLCAAVELYLIVGDQRLSLTHTAGDLVILAEPTTLSPGPAVVEVIVDGQRYRSDTVITGSDDRRQRISVSRISLSPVPHVASKEGVCQYT